MLAQKQSVVGCRCTSKERPRLDDEGVSGDLRYGTRGGDEMVKTRRMEERVWIMEDRLSL